MNEQQKAEIGARLRELRENSPETNRSISDEVGVSERTVAAWASGAQGMTYDNAQKVAALFEVDIDWLWRGKEKGETPDLLAGESSSAPQLDRIESELADLRQQIADLVARDKAVADRAAARASRKKPRQSPSRSKRKSS